MNNKKISIIIPVYNSDKDLEKTFLSIENLEYDNLEVIVIDGGSSDDTVNVIKRYEKIIYYWVSESDNGEYDAMNKGIAKASGDGLLYIMAGDYFLAKSLPENIEIPSFFYVNKLNTDDSLKPIRIKSYKQGLPNCHQGILFENNKNIKYDLDFKIAADYKYFLDFGYTDNIKLNDIEYAIVYDEGFSGNNYWQRDVEIYNIIKSKFGTFYSTLFILKAYTKKCIKQLIK